MVRIDTISVLIKREAGIDKGSGQQLLSKVGNLAIEQIIKVANEYKEKMLVNDLRSAVKSVIGSCQALGVLVEGLEAKDASKELDSGRFDNEINSGKTEASPEKLNLMKEQLNEIQARLEKEKASLEKTKEEEKPKEEPKSEEKTDGKDVKKEDPKAKKEEKKK